MEYDAFVVYNPVGEDLAFVKYLTEQLEGKYGLKLFVPERNGIPGDARHSNNAKVIARRCKRVIVVLSKHFEENDTADFELKHSHCISPGGKEQKVIPVKISSCDMPSILKPLYFVDFTEPGLLDWNIPRLVSILKSPYDSSNEDNQYMYE